MSTAVPQPKQSDAPKPVRRLVTQRVDRGSAFWTASTLLATAFILVLLIWIVGDIVIHGAPGLSWRFVFTTPEKDFFKPGSAAILPMVVGTSIRVLVMTIFVLPIGVITAIYLTEYAHTRSIYTRFIRSAIANLAGVPSIVFGLFGLGFFINFLGKNIDLAMGSTTSQFGHPSVLWASLTLAVMTLPVMIVATEESLKAITPGLREASLALGATKLQTIIRVVLPNALPGIMTGAILAISRAAGEVAPILFTGATVFMSGLPNGVTSQFMDLGYHTFILSTQSPNIDQTRPILYATVLVLLMLTFTLNAFAVVARARMRRAMRAGH